MRARRPAKCAFTAGSTESLMNVLHTFRAAPYWPALMSLLEERLAHGEHQARVELRGLGVGRGRALEEDVEVLGGLLVLAAVARGDDVDEAREALGLGRTLAGGEELLGRLLGRLVLVAGHGQVEQLGIHRLRLALLELRRQRPEVGDPLLIQVGELRLVVGVQLLAAREPVRRGRGVAPGRRGGGGRLRLARVLHRRAGARQGRPTAGRSATVSSGLSSQKDRIRTAASGGCGAPRGDRAPSRRPPSPGIITFRWESKRDAGDPGGRSRS